MPVALHDSVLTPKTNPSALLNKQNRGLNHAEHAYSQHSQWAITCWSPKKPSLLEIGPPGAKHDLLQPRLVLRYVYKPCILIFIYLIDKCGISRSNLLCSYLY